MSTKLFYLVTEDWYFCSHRLPLARAARDAGYDVSVITHVDRHGEQIRAAGLNLIPFDFRRGRIRPFAEFWNFLKLWRIFRRERPDIVHNVAVKPIILGTAAARVAGVSRVVNALAGLGYAFTSGKRKTTLLQAIAKWAFRLLFRSPAVYVIVQNTVDHGIIESLGVAGERITLIPGSGIDPSKYRLAPEPDDPVVVAMVSRMLWDKGVGELVEAARILKRSGSGIRVQLVGPMDPANPSSVPEKILSGWVAEGVVDWLGPVNNVADIWNRAHISVLPSYREGLPKSLLEAAACGRPIIATDTPGCRDVVVHGETGLLVPSRDPESLANAIIELARNPGLRERMGKAARERVEQHFSLEMVVGRTLAIYSSILVSA